MTWPVNVDDLANQLTFQTGRISDDDAARQLRTVREVLRRLGSQPGLILADEVGMGKTFVALGVACLAALRDRGRRPVVIMVPASLHEKWPRDFEVFRSLAPRDPALRQIRARSAASALDFLKLIDDPPEHKAHVIFLRHGAFHVHHIDHWVRFALMKRAMHGMHLGQRRDALPRFAARLLRTKSSYRDPALFARLLKAPYESWREVINGHYADRPDLQVDDDPVPHAVQRVLESTDIDLGSLRDALREVPARETATIEVRLEQTRRALNDALRIVWPRTLAQTRFRSPLLVLDEAHHLKNPATRLASLFVEPESAEDLASIAGTLGSAFERMLFLTATPFQLGHEELLNVIDRFRGIDWKTLPGGTVEDFVAERERLGACLDQAQHRALEFDRRWQTLRPDDVPGQMDEDARLDDWWADVLRDPADHSERVRTVHRAYEDARMALKDAERALDKWIIRHLRDRRLPVSSETRRRTRAGSGILLDGPVDDTRGLAVTDEALLPFLLAARAQAMAVRQRDSTRATFAEGLASSYEAYLDTRRPDIRNDHVDEAPVAEGSAPVRLNRYLLRLEKALPSQAAFARHPKVSAVVSRALDLWSQGEKLVIFCHFRETGRALVRHLSAAFEDRLWADASRRTGLSTDRVQQVVGAFGERFDADDPMRAQLDLALNVRLHALTQFDEAERTAIRDVIRRFVRTPLFVARYFDVISPGREGVVDRALATRDSSGAALGDRIDAFLRFLATRCEPYERQRYLEALHRVHPGPRGERPSDAEDAVPHAGAELLPNIRLANGSVRQETRQRLMLSFNTPFFPDVLVASSVLAEGVDLHLNCRHVIHHDLSWNPSTLEQRTGRVDRLGAKAEQVSQPIQVFLPYIGATQDEKQYRVVMDRERWFQVLMGEDYRTDEWHTDAIMERIPLPPGAAEALAFDFSTINEDHS